MDNDFLVGGWTAEQRRTLVRMHAEGATRQEISRATGKSAQAVSDEAGWLDLSFAPGVPWIWKRLDTLRQLAARGLTRAECAVALECSLQQVREAAEEHDIAFLHPQTGVWKGYQPRA